jgi:hypothetical protein
MSVNGAFTTRVAAIAPGHNAVAGRQLMLRMHQFFSNAGQLTTTVIGGEDVPPMRWLKRNRWPSAKAT